MKQNKQTKELAKECLNIGIEIKFGCRDKGYYFSMKDLHDVWIDSAKNNDSLSEAVTYLRNIIKEYL